MDAGQIVSAKVNETVIAAAHTFDTEDSLLYENITRGKNSTFFCDPVVRL